MIHPKHKSTEMQDVYKTTSLMKPAYSWRCPRTKEKRPRNKSVIMFRSYKLDSWNLARKQALDRAVGLGCLLYSCLCKRTNNAFSKSYSVLNCLRSTVCVLLCSSSTRDGTQTNDVTI